MPQTTMYYPKLVSGTKETMLPPSTHMEITNMEDGIVIQLMPSGQMINLPEDGSEFYIINEERKTVGIHRWPPKDKQVSTNLTHGSGKEFRA